MRRLNLQQLSEQNRLTEFIRQQGVDQIQMTFIFDNGLLITETPETREQLVNFAFFYIQLANLVQHQNIIADLYDSSDNTQTKLTCDIQSRLSENIVNATVSILQSITQQ